MNSISLADGTSSSGTSNGQALTILVVAVVSSSHLSGVPRHAVNLVRCLLSLSEVESVHFAIAPWQSGALQSYLPSDNKKLHIHEVQVGTGAAARNLWYYHQLPRLASKVKASILHLAYPVPIKRAAYACPTVVTLHDLYPYDIPENFGFPKMLFNRVILQQCLNASDAIACVSESTMRRLDLYAPGLAQQKTLTIYNCVDQRPLVSSASPLPGWNGERFVLCVAQHRRNKNVLLAIKVFARLHREGDLPHDSKLLVLGIEGPETAGIRRYLKQTGLNDRVCLLHGISDASLEWCYAHCDFLLAPSIVEGFGLPIVEAMLHQCRIVCSDIPAFREVGGSHCEYASLEGDAESAFVQATRTALSSHRFRVAPSDQYSSSKVAQQYLLLYQKLLGEVPHRSVEGTLKEFLSTERGHS